MKIFVLKQAEKKVHFISSFIPCSICLIVAGLYLTAARHAGAENLQQDHSAAVSANRTADDQSITAEKIIGRWNRTDGNYTIEIKKMNSRGLLGVAYSNPKPINIAQTKISSEKTKIFIKLQDKGYPGSTYTLDYIPSDDLFKGTYFHAGIQQSFQVIFTREKQLKK